MVLPMAHGKAYFEVWNFSELSTLFIETVSGLLFGTSMPMVPLPGIGAMIRMPKAAKLKAMSSSRFLIFEILTPAAGTISYKVTVGPMVALILSMAMP